MPITFPLSHPVAPGFRAIEWAPRSIVGLNASPFTGQQQIYAWPGQWWEATVSLPPMKEAQAGNWAGFFLALNGREGTFLLGDSVRTTRLGAVTGTLSVGAGAVANSTTLPIAGASGTFAVGDWLQVFTGLSSRLHRVVQVNSATSVDVFPRLRSAYANTSPITYASPRGLFRLASLPAWAMDERKICAGLSFTAVEALS
jgi:hypothetical protein